MSLLQLLEIDSVGELDPALPLSLGPLELSAQATVEAIRILEGGEFPQNVEVRNRTFHRPVYWSIYHSTEGDAELFGFPAGVTGGLTTAIELALVRAIAASEQNQHIPNLTGDAEIIIGSPLAYRGFQRLFAVVEPPLVGDSLLVNQANQASVKEDIDKRLTAIPLTCIANSFRTSPLKFRFIELYRVMEALFLANVKTKLLADFDMTPGEALADASESLKSEMNQIMGLAETEHDAFEACWSAFNDLENRNRFITKLFQRLKSKRGEAAQDGREKSGAALIYQMRCAIVHAGARDMIFENFPDGDEALAAVYPEVERAVLRLIGIHIS